MFKAYVLYIHKNEDYIPLSGGPFMSSGTFCAMNIAVWTNIAGKWKPSTIGGHND